MRAKGRLSLTGGGVELDVRRLLDDGAAPDLKAVAQQLEGVTRRDGSGTEAVSTRDHSSSGSGAYLKHGADIGGDRSRGCRVLAASRVVLDQLFGQCFQLGIVAACRNVGRRSGRCCYKFGHRNRGVPFE